MNDHRAPPDVHVPRVARIAAFASALLIASQAVGATATARAPSATAPVGLDPALQSFVTFTLTAVRERHGVPAIAGAVLVDGRIVALAASGRRATNGPESAGVDDLWHLGSDTKAFTATLLSRLAEQGVLSLDEPLSTALPSLSEAMNPAFRDVSIAALLSHTAGLPALTDPAETGPFDAAIASARDVRAQRLAIARAYLSQPPASPVGAYRYSNVGFIVAGAIAEQRTGRTWEELLQAQVFAPLGMTRVGFGAPGTPGRRDQPWGHDRKDGAWVPLDPGLPSSDNPPALGPAGTMHASLRDWLLFVFDQLDGARGGGALLTPAGYRRLHTPVSGNYALGWGAKLGPDGRPIVLTHTGSNGYWLSYVAIHPKHGRAYVLALNAGAEPADAALKDLVEAFRERLGPAD